MKLRTFIEDVVAYGSIGARTVESPVHRQLAASLAMPIGFKNSRSGWATQEWRHVTTGDDHYAIFKYIYNLYMQSLFMKYFVGVMSAELLLFSTWLDWWPFKNCSNNCLGSFHIRAMHRKNVSHLPLRFVPFASWIPGLFE